MGGPITQFILFKAAIFDAIVILMLAFVSQKFFVGNDFVIIFSGLAVAVAMEIWALQTARWQYNDLMPIIPFLNIGLTPAIQLALTGWVSQKVVSKR
ncbi:MAG: hypothetical protein AAB877_01795 [Patescibacteria group bacterium]